MLIRIRQKARTRGANFNKVKKKKKEEEVKDGKCYSENKQFKISRVLI